MPRNVNRDIGDSEWDLETRRRELGSRDTALRPDSDYEFNLKRRIAIRELGSCEDCNDLVCYLQHVSSDGANANISKPQW